MKKINFLKINIVASLFFQVLSLASNLIIPKLLLEAYGSTVNGLIASITQSLSFFVLTDMGIGAVVIASLYKPLNDGNYDEVSKIIRSGQKFFNAMAAILTVYVGILIWIYVSQMADFDAPYVITLTLAMALNSFTNYFMGRINTFVLQADQKIYISMFINSVVYILNIMACVILMKIGVTVQLYKWISALILMLHPIGLKIYVQRHYPLRKIGYTEEPLKQKWNGLAHHVASVVFNNTDVIILTWGSSLETVSVYAIYSGVVRGVQCLITSITSSVQSHLGVLYAKKDINKLRDQFHLFELAMHIGATILYGCTAVLITPFVEVYTQRVHDYNYSAPIFGCLLSLAYMVHSYRSTYYVMILAAGHFRETQKSLWIEVTINIALSFLFVRRTGLIGVVIGTLAAMSYQALYMAIYSAKYILDQTIHTFFKHILVDFIVIGMMFLLSNNIKMYSVSYSAWILLAIKVFLISCSVALLVNGVFFKESFGQLLFFKRPKHK